MSSISTTVGYLPPQFAPILLPKCSSDADMLLVPTNEEQDGKRGPSPLVSRLLKRLRAPASSPRVPFRVLKALSEDDQDALFAARVEKEEISEGELISLLHPQTRDTLHIIGCSHIRNSTLRRCLEACAPNLVSIDLSHSTQVNNSVVSRILLHPRLQSLVLTGCSRISDSAFSQTHENSAAGDCCMHELTTLKLGGCPQLTTKGIERIINIFPYLEEVDISRCHRLTNTAISMLLSTCSSLRLLKASHLSAVDDGAFTNGGACGNSIEVYGANGVMGYNITCIHLDGCAISDKTLDSLSLHALGIEHLSVRWCNNLTMQGLQRFLMSSPSLMSIDITDLGFQNESFCFFAGRVINPNWLDP